MTMNQTTSSQSQLHAVEKTHATNTLSMIGDWLAPIIACLAVIALCLSILGFLLGEE
jgi:hypothetical protein